MKCKSCDAAMIDLYCAEKHRDQYWCEECGTICTRWHNFDEPKDEWTVPRDCPDRPPHYIDGVPDHAWRDTSFCRAVGIVWGYFNSPETNFVERFGHVENPVARYIQADGDRAMIVNPSDWDNDATDDPAYWEEEGGDSMKDWIDMAAEGIRENYARWEQEAGAISQNAESTDVGEQYLFEMIRNYLRSMSGTPRGERE